MAKREGRRRRHPLVLGAAALLLLAVVAVPVIWWIARDQVASALENAQRDAARDGIELRHEGLSFSGFPFHLSAVVAKPGAAWSGGSWQGPESLQGETSFSDPTLLSFDGSGRHRLILDGLPVTIESRKAEALIEVGSAGPVAVEAALADTEILFDQAVGKASLDALFLAAAPLPPLSDAAQQTAIALDLSRLTLPAVLGAAFPSLGAVIESGSLRARLSGPLLPGPAPESLQAWRLGGGFLDLESLALAWGPFALEGRGRLQLDEALRPAGELRLEIAGLTAVLDTLADLGRLEPALARTYGGLLGGMARERSGREGRWLAVPLVLRDGRAFLKLPLGQIPLARLSPIVPTG